VTGTPLCRSGECMTTCPASATTTTPIPPPPPPPPTITVTCPEGTRMGLNGQCFFVDPGCQGPNCPQPVLPTCIGKDCPTPTTTTCPIAQVSVNGQCCNIREYETGKCGGTTTDCPAGTRRGLNGQCFFVDPGCQGPNCGPVTTGCPFNAARKADGSCCTGRDYQVGGACGGDLPRGFLGLISSSKIATASRHAAPRYECP